MSDVHYMLNDWAVPKMSEFGVQCPGHEGAGVVVKVGAKVQDAWKVGDRVGIKPLLDVCHNCESCWNGRMSILHDVGCPFTNLLVSQVRITAPKPSTLV